MNLKLLFVLIWLPIFGICQYNPTLSQIIKNPEFINPGYNASKDWLSATILLTNYYTNGYADGGNVAINLNAPITQWNTGLGLNFMADVFDKMDKVNIDLNSYVALPISKKSSLSFGICGGIQAISYFKNDGYSNQNTYDSILYQNSKNLHAGFGINFFTPKLNLGTSLHYQQSNKDTNSNPEFYTYYMNGSYCIELDEDLMLKPIMLLSMIQENANLDYGTLIVYENIASIGVVHRVKRAASLHAGLKIFKVIHFDYCYNFFCNNEKDKNFGPHEFGIQIQMPSFTMQKSKSQNH